MKHQHRYFIGGLTVVVAIMLVLAWGESVGARKHPAIGLLDKGASPSGLPTSPQSHESTSDLGEEPPAVAGWATEVADAGKSCDIGSRSLALDSSQQPHIAYGGDKLYYARQTDQGWQLETIDYGWGTGGEQSLALDGSDRPHISYYDSLNKRLKYTTYDGSDWRIDIVDTTASGSFAHSSIAVDGDGRPGISYYDDSERVLKYAHYDGSQWNVETIDTSAFSNGETSLAVDSGDAPHISYGGFGELRYAHWTGTNWVTATVDSGSGVGQYTSLALDSNDRPHISYQDGGNEVLKYAYWTGTAWAFDIIDDNITWRQNESSIAVDSSDNPVVVYNNTNTGFLYYARWSGSSWTREVVYDESGVFFSSLALSATDWPRIALTASDDLIYTHWTGSRWVTETVDRGGKRSKPVSLVMAPTSSYTPHVVYEGDVLTYGIFDGTGWLTETMGADANYGSLALTPVSPYHPQIAFRGSTHNDVRHALQEDGDWQITVVDPEGGHSIDLAVDPNAPYTPHLAYVVDTDIRHAFWDGGEWVTQTVAYGGSQWMEALGAPDIAVDSSGTPHILYHGQIYHGRLEYASWTGSDWEIESLGYMGNSYVPTALALDSLDNPHVLFVSAYVDEVTYGYHDGSDWAFELLETHRVDYVSLDIDSQDRPHASYFRGSPDAALVYGVRDNGAWSLEVVDRPAGNDVSLALDGDNHPRIAYQKGVDLMFAWQTSVATIGVDGGTFNAYETAEFSFEPGTFTDTVTISYTVAQPFGDLTHTGIFFDLSVVYADTGEPVQPAPGHAYDISIYYSEAAIPYGVDEESLALFYWNGEEWVKEPTSALDPAKNILSATPEHFSLWGALFLETHEIFLPIVLR